MRLQIFIFLVLFAAMFVTESEAGWGRRRTLRKVGKWVKKNPQAPVAIGKATLSLGKRQTPSDDAVMEALAEACGDFPEDAAPTDAVTEAFMEADVNGDGQLSEEEAAEFAKMLEVADFCSGLIEANQVI